MGRADAEEVRAELAALAAAEDWEGLLQVANTALKPLGDDVVVLNHAARARLALAAPEDLAAAVAEARGWLDTALGRSPGQAESLYLRGLAEYLAGDGPAAEDYWRQAWQADPQRAAARDGLIRVWTEAGRLPEWGVAVVESALADTGG